MTIQIQRRGFILSLGGAVIALPLAASAQQPDRPKRIGMLMNLASDDSESNDRLSAFLQALHQSGWIEGRNVRIYARWGAGDVDSFRRYAVELVALAPDVILAASSPTLGPLQSRQGIERAAHNALRGSGPGQKPAFEMHWHWWVVLIAGSTGSALRAVRPPNLHIASECRRDLVTPPVRRVPCSAHLWPSSPKPSGRSCWRARSPRPSWACAPTARRAMADVCCREP
jgi:hypothetical protein